MRILIFDTETTGLNPIDNVILQLSYQIVDLSDWSIVKTVNHYFPWPDERWRVQEKAIEINGLTEAFLSTQKLSDKKVALEEFVKDKDSVNLLVAHNLEFDKRFILAECKKCGVKYASSGWSNVYDTMKETTDLCCIEYYGRGYKYPKLIELAEFLNINSLDLNLHDSSSDVELTKRCFKSLVQKGYYMPEKTDTGISVHLQVESPDDIRYTFYNDKGEQLEESLLEMQYGKKAVSEPKQELLRMWAEQNEEERDELKDIGFKMQLPKEMSEYEAELKALTPASYTRQQFSESQPNRETIERELTEEAQKQIKSILFWTNASKRKEYVAERLDATYNKRVEEYNKRKAEFEKNEDEKELSFNQKAQESFEKRKASLQGLIRGEKAFIEKAMIREKIYSYPLAISVKTELVTADQIEINVTLPQLSDIPQMFGDRLASGNYKIKELSDKDKRGDYAIDVTGLGFYLASCYLGAVPTVTTAKVVGWQKEDNADAQAIYAFVITKDQIKELCNRKFVASEEIVKLPHAMDLTKTFLFKPIDPMKLKDPIVE